MRIAPVLDTLLVSIDIDMRVNGDKAILIVGRKKI